MLNTNSPHQPTPPHLHTAASPRTCPFASKHSYCCPQKGDSRSVCPALNTMANHGYLPRNGDAVTLLDLIRGLQECYGLTWFLAAFLAVGGFVLLRWWPWRVFRLEEIGKHGAVEHDASLVHEDARGRRYAPTRIHPRLVTELADEALHTYRDDDKFRGEDGEEVVWTPYHAACARVRREKAAPTLDAVHAEIARGEIAIMLCVWDYALDEARVSSAPRFSKHDNTDGMPIALARALEAHEKTVSLQPSAPEALTLGLPTSDSAEFASNAASPVKSNFTDAAARNGHCRGPSVGNDPILTAATSAFRTREQSAEPESRDDRADNLLVNVGGTNVLRVVTHDQPCDELRGIPLSWWLKFLAEERLPDGVVGHGVKHGVGILDVVRKSTEIRAGMEYILQSST